METQSKEKWKRSLMKLRSKASTTLSSVSGIEEEEETDMEVAAYLSTLKQKTGVRGLWSGVKFQEMVDNDRTPDISINSSADENVFKNLNNISLDSVEDEMRIDYLRDENNNNRNSPQITEEASFNLLDNLKLAELDADEIQLSESKPSEKEDFLPNILALQSSPTANSQQDSDSIDHSRVLTEQPVSEPLNKEEEDTLSSTSSIQDDSLKTNNISEDIHFQKISNVLKFEILTNSSHDMNKLTNDQLKETAKSRSSSNSPRKSHNSTKSDSLQSNSHKSYYSKSLSQSHSTRTSSKSLPSSSYSSSSKSHSTKSKSHSKSHSHNTTKSHSLKSLASETTRAHRSRTHQSSTQHSTKRHAKKSQKILKQNNAYTQTATPSDDQTKEVLDFLHTWQQPSSIMQHMINPQTVDALTSYNPAILAAHDLLKMHLALVQRHLADSRRLYESYTATCSSGYEYTSVEETQAFIEKHRPKVISYQEALRQVNKSG